MIFLNYVIIGNGVAGTTAAANIRKQDSEGSIRIITDEAYPFYTRIRLVEFPAGGVTETELILRKSEWYEENKIDLQLNDKVIDVKTDEKMVFTASGQEVTYDKLLLAMGSHSFVPPIPGSDKPGVFTLRTIKDAVAIKEHVVSGNKNVVIIGGGVLGLEVANYLRKAGCPVSIVEFFERLLPRQMDPGGSECLQAQMESLGFGLYLNAASEEIVGEHKVESLKLKDGRIIECDTIIISAGVRPNADLVKKLGLEFDKGVVVNDKMETSAPDIYAAGDLIQHNGIYYGIWPASEKQGEIAGINMAGGSVEYKGTTISNRLKVIGIDLLAAGHIDADGKHESIVYKNKDDFTYKKLVIENNTLIGTILYGDIKNWKKVMNAIETKKDISGIKSQLESWKLESL